MKLKTMIKRIANRLPKKMRAPISRTFLNLEYSLPEGLSFKVADTEEELRASFQILHDAYVETGLMNENPTRMRITEYHHEPTSVILLVKHFSEVVGTVTVVRDSKRGLPGDKIYDLSEYRKNNRVLAEISALAIKKEWRGQVFFPFMKYMFETTLNHLGINTVVAVAHSSWSQFYEDFLLFKPIKQQMIEGYSFANNLPVKGLTLNLDECYHLHSQCYAAKPIKQNLFYYFWIHKEKSFQFMDTIYHSIINPCYRAPLIAPETPPSEGRSGGSTNQRLAMCSNGLLLSKNCEQSVEILNISAEGLKLRMKERPNKERNLSLVPNDSIKQTEEFVLMANLGPFCTSKIKVQKIWSNLNNEAGFKVIATDDGWMEYIGFLQLGNDPKANVIQFPQTRMTA
jgi:hypothetical protein